MSQQALEYAILATFEQALAEGQAAVAEHLLKALETLCENDELDASSLASAYLIAADPKLVRRS